MRSMMFRWGVAGLAGMACLAVGAGPGRATTMYAAWSTWMRAGPAAQYRVLDEIPAGWPVEVEGCEQGWCRVVSDRAPGYVPQALLVSAKPGVGAVAPGGGCVPGQRFTPEGPLVMRLCAGAH